MLSDGRPRLEAPCNVVHLNNRPHSPLEARLIHMMGVVLDPDYSAPHQETIDLVESVALDDEATTELGRTLALRYVGEIALVRELYESAYAELEVSDPDVDPGLDSHARSEAEASKITDSSKVVFVGSGSNPQTVITYATQAGSVTGIDYDPIAVARAKQLKVSRSPVVQYLVADGRTFNYDGYTHVGVAAMAEGKPGILRRIAETQVGACTVLVRTVEPGLHELIHASLPGDAIPDGLVIIDKISTSEAINHTLILQKEAS